MIEAVDLKKSFASPPKALFGRAEMSAALNGVSFRIERGRAMTLVGPNGAGKTTLLKILIGLVLPTSGRAAVCGVDCSSASTELKRSIGYSGGDERSFYWRLTGRQNLEYFAALYGIGFREIPGVVTDALKLVGLAKESDQRFNAYSSGMRQRLALARAMLHDPPALLFDEPGRGLDPVDRHFFRRFVRDELAGRRGKTILIATHDVDEALELEAETLVMKEGRAVALRRFRDAQDLRDALSEGDEGRGFRI